MKEKIMIATLGSFATAALIVAALVFALIVKNLWLELLK